MKPPISLVPIFALRNGLEKRPFLELVLSSNLIFMSGNPAPLF
jgi:hypothetical protein